MTTEVKKETSLAISRTQLIIVFAILILASLSIAIMAVLNAFPPGLNTAQPMTERSMEAYSARLTSLSEYYKEVRAQNAYSARNAALAEYFTERASAEQRATNAYSARLRALGAYYTGHPVVSLRGLQAYADRLTALAAYYEDLDK